MGSSCFFQMDALSPISLCSVVGSMMLVGLSVPSALFKGIRGTLISCYQGFVAPSLLSCATSNKDVR